MPPGGAAGFAPTSRLMIGLQTLSMRLATHGRSDPAGEAVLQGRDLGAARSRRCRLTPRPGRDGGRQSRAEVCGRGCEAEAASSLSAVLVSPREPAVPFAGSDGRVTVTYELGVHNPTPFALTLTTAEFSTRPDTCCRSWSSGPSQPTLPLPSERSGVKQPTEGRSPPCTSRSSSPAAPTRQRGWTTG